MKNLKLGFKKYLRGMVGIFVIKLCVFGLIATNQSCITEDSFPETNAKQLFLSELKITAEKIKNVRTKKRILTQDAILKKSNENGILQVVEEVTIICTKDMIVPSDSTTTQKVTLEDFILLDIKPISDETLEDNEFCYSFSNEDVQSAIAPLTSASSDYLKAKGFTDNEIIEMLDGEDESYLIPIIMEATRNQNPIASSFLNNFVETAYAQGSVRDCFLESTGIAAGVALIAALTATTLDKTLVIKLMKRAVKKIGGRVLGGVGLALMILDFTYCVATIQDA